MSIDAFLRTQSQFQFGDWPQEPHITTIHEGRKVTDVKAM